MQKIKLTPKDGISQEANSKLKNMSENASLLENFLKEQGRIFKHNPAVVLEFFNENMSSKAIAPRQQWEAYGYKIKDNEKCFEFKDENDGGKTYELYDFSQTDGVLPPKTWSYTLQNSAIVKNIFGISENESVLSGIMKQVENTANIQAYAAELRISPQNYNAFKNSFIKNTAVIIAGRLASGGVKFNVNADTEGLKMCRSIPDKINLLSFAQETAKVQLMRIEKTLRETDEQKKINEQEKNDDLSGNREIRRELDGRGNLGNAEEYAAPRNTDGTTNERVGMVENEVSIGKSESYPDTGLAVEKNEFGGVEMVTDVRGRGEELGNDVVDIYANSGNLSEEHRAGSERSGGTDRDIRAEVAGLDKNTPQRSSEFNAPSGEFLHSGTVSGQSGLGLSRHAERGIQQEQLPTSDGILRNGSLGNSEENGDRQYGDERSGFTSENSAIKSDTFSQNSSAVNKLFANLAQNETETPAENSAGVSAYVPVTVDESLTEITAEIEAAKILLSKMASEGDFRGVGIIGETIEGLKQQQEPLYDFLRRQNITKEYILYVRSKISGYTSVMNLTETQKSACSRLEKLFDELGEISPFVRREKDNLLNDNTAVEVFNMQDVYTNNDISIDELKKTAYP